MEQSDISEESTFSFIISRKDGSFKPDRIVISQSLSYPKILTIKIVGSELVPYFSNLFDLDLSASVDAPSANQIIGAYSVFKITPELYDSITKNKDLSDMNVAIDSSKQVYGVIKRFLLSNPENFQKTLNEAVAYIDTYIKTQLSKYSISDDMFVPDPKQTLFLLFAGKQKQYESDTLSSLIKNQADNKIPEVPRPVTPPKKGFFASIFGPKPKPSVTATPNIKPNEKIDQKTLEKKQNKINKKEKDELEKEIKDLEKQIETKPKGRGILSTIWETWREDAFEPIEKREKRIELEHKEQQYKLDLANQKIELLKKKKELKEKLKNNDSDNKEKDSGAVSNQKLNDEDEEQ